MNLEKAGYKFHNEGERQEAEKWYKNHPDLIPKEQECDLCGRLFSPFSDESICPDCERDNLIIR